MAIQTMFKFFELEGDANYALTREEMEAGMAQMADDVAHFYSEYNYFWNFINLDGDDCVTLPELQTTVISAYDVTEAEITQYWINYYWITYQITEYYWWIYHLPNGGFDFEGYYKHVPDGPAFDGMEWLVVQGDWESGTIYQAFMWYLNNQCYFALSSPDNTDPNSSGTCTVDGHKTVSQYHHGMEEEHVAEIQWYFSSQSEYSFTFGYHLGEWGPIAEMTDNRYYVDGADFWLWEKPSGHCSVCESFDGWYTITGLDVTDDEITMGSDGEIIVGGDPSSWGPDYDDSQ